MVGNTKVIEGWRQSAQETAICWCMRRQKSYRKARGTRSKPDLDEAKRVSTLENNVIVRIQCVGRARGELRE